MSVIIACDKEDDPKPTIEKLDQVFVGEVTDLNLEGAENYTWTSDDESIATVSNGVVSGVAAGKCIITGESSSAIYKYTIEVKLKNIDENKEILIGNKLDLELAEADNYHWSSDNIGIATVDDHGNVTAVAIGTCIITAEGAEAVYTFNISVKEKPIVAGDDIEIIIANTKDLNETGTFSWKSSDEDIATVSNRGLVTAVAIGECVISRTGENEILEYKLTVISKTVVKKDVSIKEGETYNTQLSGPYEWTNTDETIATVENGIIGGVKEGTCIIKTEDATKIYEFNVKVLPEAIELVIGASHDLELANAAAYTWTSSNDAVASVDVGVVTAVGEGTCTITATPARGVAITYTITVVSGTTTITVGQSHDLEYPNAAIYTWESTDDAVATVDAGIVTGVAPGTCTVKVLSRGNVLEEFSIEVKSAPGRR